MQIREFDYKQSSIELLADYGEGCGVEKEEQYIESATSFV